MYGAPDGAPPYAENELPEVFFSFGEKRREGRGRKKSNPMNL